MLGNQAPHHFVFYSTDLGFSKIPLAFKSPYHETHPNSHLMKHTFNIHENRFGECRHEIVGIVTEVGSKVGKFKVGDRVGVGCIVGACHSCECCDNDLENYCPKMVFTYSAPYHDGTTTYGGYSDVMVAEERYVVRIPDNLPLDAGAPLLCAGITVYSPLQHFGLTKPGMHIGVVGLGGLGHVAVKFAKGFGVKVTVISTSPSKKKEAIEHLGADYFLVSREPDQMQIGKLEYILCLCYRLSNLVNSIVCNRFVDIMYLNFCRLPWAQWMASLIQSLLFTLFFH